jgi:proteasome alpha subunit
MYPAVNPQAYDRAITVFSPDGRLFQVEYAKEAVRRGATAIGVTGGDSVVLVAYKNLVSPLLVFESMKKVYKVDDHIAATASGLVADARRLVDIARLEAQKYKLQYNEPIDVETLTKHLSDLAQIYTQYGGIRPFGVTMLVAGIDTNGPKLFESEPSGALTGYKATAIGSGKKEAESFLEKEYKEGLKVDDVVALAIKTLRKSEDVKLKPETVDIAIATTANRTFKVLEPSEVAKYL